ncbi:MAG TPA: YheU family protein [Terriglobales bacterium]|nr:YheU family protein [Terriglobales bacterium]
MNEAIDVPYDALAPGTLRAVVEEFITRSGTDYGEREVSLAAKVADVMRQLERREAKLVFDPASNQVSIVPAPR